MKQQSCLLVIVLMSFLPMCGMGKENIQERLNNSLRNIQSITNVEIDWLDTLSVQDPDVLRLANSKTYVRTFRYSYVASAQKYRATCKLISGTQTNLTELLVSAFDGKSYVTYTDEQRYMTTRSHDTIGEGDNAQSAMNPLVAPFMFLTKRSDQCKLCMMRFVDIASSAFTNELVLPSAKESNGLFEFSTSGVPWDNQTTTWTIVMKEVGDSFTPKTIVSTVPALHYKTSYLLLNYTNLGAYKFPSRIEWSTSVYPPTIPPTVLSTGLVTLISARKPVSIAESMFRLDDEKKLAKTVWNWDRDTFTKTAPKLIKAETKSRIVRNILLLILFITAVVPIVIVVSKRVVAHRR